MESLHNSRRRKGQIVFIPVLSWPPRYCQGAIRAMGVIRDIAPMEARVASHFFHDATIIGIVLLQLLPENPRYLVFEDRRDHGKTPN